MPYPAVPFISFPASNDVERRRRELIFPWPAAIPQFNELDNFTIQKTSEPDEYRVYYSLGYLRQGHPQKFKVPELLPGPGMPEHLSLRQAKQVQFYYPNQPYLAFVPLDDVFEGPIFGRFQGTSAFFETKVEGTVGYFIFNSTLAQSWLRVEIALIHIITTLYPRLVPLDTPQPQLPSSTKFHMSRTSRSAVVKSVLYAQKLFIFLIAQLCHALACSRKVGREGWVKALENQDSTKYFDKAWVSDLYASRAVQTNRRAGMVVRRTDTLTPYDAHLINIYGAPVYIEYANILLGVDGSHFVESLMDDAISRKFYLPFPVKDALVRINALWLEGLVVRHHVPYVPRSQPAIVDLQPISVQPGTEGDYHPLSSPQPEEQRARNMEEEEGLPLPLPNSEQKPGQWWHVHHLEQKRSRDLEIYTESKAEEKDRLELEKEAEKVNGNSTLPSSFSGKVFVWEPTQLHPTFLLRRLLTLKETKLLWPIFLPSHRVYNFLDDCWDIYDMSCDFETYKHVGLNELETNAAEENLGEGSMPANPLPTCDLELDRREVMQGQYEQVQLGKQPLFYHKDAQGYMAHRFGFRFPEPPIIFHPEEQIKWWYFAGLRDIPDPEISKQISSTMYCLKEKDKGHLRALLDIFSDASLIIDRNHVEIRRCPKANFRTPHAEETSRNLYLIIFSSENKQDWFVGVEQAADVVLALRENWFESRDHLVASYLTHGIRFHTLRPFSREIKPHLPDPAANLRIPSEPTGGKYNLTDFFNYEKVREEILDSELGRVIGRSGGNAARLWRRDFRKFKQRMRQVNAGPTEFAMSNGVHVSCGGKVFYDDLFTTHLESLVCGEYISQAVVMTFKDKSGRVREKTVRPKMSWYPTRVLVDARSEAANRWTDVLESQFESIEKKIYNEHQPHNAAEWKSIALSKPGQLDKWYEPFAIDFVDKYIQVKEMNTRS